MARQRTGETLTVEIEIILKSEELLALLESAEASGQLRHAELQEVLEPLELDPLEVDAVYIELDRRGIELLEEAKEEPPPPPPGVQPVETTTDALQLFLREAGKHAPLSGAQEVERAVKSGRGWSAAGSGRRKRCRRGFTSPSSRPAKWAGRHARPRASTSRSASRKTRCSGTSSPATTRSRRNASRSRCAVRRSCSRS